MASGGQTFRIALPIEVLNGLLMTLPSMLQSALNERFPDGTLRIVHPLGDWRLEQCEGDGGLILRLATGDGFDVAFTVPEQDAGSPGKALLATSRQTLPLTRRPN